MDLQDPGVNNLFVGGNGIYQESYSGTKIEVTKNSLNMNNGSDNDDAFQHMRIILLKKLFLMGSILYK